MVHSYVKYKQLMQMNWKETAFPVRLSENYGGYQHSIGTMNDVSE